MKVSRIIIIFFCCQLLTGIVIAQVKVWEEPIVIPTCEIGDPEVNPTFLWSSTRKPVYPYPYKEILTNNKVDKTYTACWLENEYVKVLVTPELGGKLYGAKDKTNDYNFFYWQPTVKPALIGMTGAWVSGGIEWNFPHGHRPSSFSPVSYRLVENSDGSKTVWVGETEWVNRMRWVVGMTLYPGKSVIEAKVLLLNPTPIHHSYYMWANTTTNTNENYQVIYPTRLMTEHGKFEYFHFPIHEGVDISWWKNIPNASSLFAVEQGEFFGGYDQGRQAGTIITGNKYITIGKKFWTWGTSPFGRMWDWILSDGEGPYIEPQAGAYADNQPDNHWLEPGEVKSFSYFFYPVRDIGGYKQANVDGALNLEFDGDEIKIGVYSTATLKSAMVRLIQKEKTIFEKTLDIDPSRPLVHSIKIKNASEYQQDFTLSLLDQNGIKLVSYTPKILEPLPLPEPAKVFEEPEKVKTGDELWHIGEMKSKYKAINLRQGFKDYFKEAIKRDPGNTRAHISLAEWDIKSANYQSALEHLEITKSRDPDNGKIFYLQTVAKEALGEYESAYAHYYRSVHFQEYLPRAYERIARLDLRNRDFHKAVIHCQKAIESNTLNPHLWALKATSLRLNGKPEKAVKAANHALTLDPINPWAMNELILSQEKANEKLKDALKKVLTDDYQFYIELACCYMNCGLYDDASKILECYKKDNALINYYNAFCKSQSGKEKQVTDWFKSAQKLTADYIFPFRREAIGVFQMALQYNPKDGRAHYYLGLVYAGLEDMDKAILHWQKAVQLDPENARAWRNLGLGLFHKGQELNKAKQCYETAFKLAPKDSRILIELDQVKEILGENSTTRLSFLMKHKKVVEGRDALLTTMLDLMVQHGHYEEALNYYLTHHFHNWEGRYAIHNAFMEANIGMAKAARTTEEALKCYLQACEYPENLEVAPREPNLRGFLYYPMSKLYKQVGNEKEANRLLKITADEISEKPTLGSYYRALALRDLGQSGEANKLLSNLRTEGQQLIEGKTEGYENKSKDFRWALGHFYLSMVHEASDQSEDAQLARKNAISRVPLIEKEALIFAQIVYAKAKQ